MGRGRVSVVQLVKGLRVIPTCIWNIQQSLTHVIGRVFFFLVCFIVWFSLLYIIRIFFFSLQSLVTFFFIAITMLILPTESVCDNNQVSYRLLVRYILSKIEGPASIHNTLFTRVLCSTSICNIFLFINWSTILFFFLLFLSRKFFFYTAMISSIIIEQLYEVIFVVTYFSFIVVSYFTNNSVSTELIISWRGRVVYNHIHI